jgi:CBS domain-containing protein
MLDDPVRRVMQRKNVLKARPRTTVSKAAALMAAKNVGAILVVDAGRLVGIFTERDVVFRVVARGLDPATTTIAEVMTPDPQTIDSERPLGYALVLMRRGGYRHLPVMREGKPVGIVSSRIALDPDLEEFTSEIHRRKRYDLMGQRGGPAD